MYFEVKADTSEVERMLGDLSGKANLVMARASNRAAGTAKKTMKQEVAAKYRIGASTVGNTLEVRNANRNRPFAVVVSKGYHSGLEKFKVSPFRAVRFSGQEGRKRPSPGVYKAAVKKGEGLKGLGKRAFVATMGNGHTGIFRRTDRTQAKGNAKRRSKRSNSGIIEGLYGPSVPQIIGNKEVMRKVEAASGKMLHERIEHEVDVILEKYAD